MSQRHELLDDNGNAIAPPPSDSDVAQLIYLLEYARKRGFILGEHVKVGTVTVQVQDPVTIRRLAKNGETVQETSIWKAAGYDGDEGDD